jgi:hypothetical protein
MSHRSAAARRAAAKGMPHGRRQRYEEQDDGLFHSRSLFCARIRGGLFSPASELLYQR